MSVMSPPSAADMKKLLRGVGGGGGGGSGRGRRLDSFEEEEEEETGSNGGSNISDSSEEVVPSGPAPKVSGRVRGGERMISVYALGFSFAKKNLNRRRTEEGGEGVHASRMPTLFDVSGFRFLTSPL